MRNRNSLSRPFFDGEFGHGQSQALSQHLLQDGRLKPCQKSIKSTVSQNLAIDIPAYPVLEASESEYLQTCINAFDTFLELVPKLNRAEYRNLTIHLQQRIGRNISSRVRQLFEIIHKLLLS
jgi:hypothetical protein